MSVLLEGIIFYGKTKKVEEGSSATQQVIYAEVRGDLFPVVKFVSSDKMYKAGLEKNYKAIASMSEMSDHLAYLLTAHAKLGASVEKYNIIMEAYSEFIDKRMTFPELMNRSASALSSDGWV